MTLNGIVKSQAAAVAIIAGLFIAGYIVLKNAVDKYSGNNPDKSGTASGASGTSIVDPASANTINGPVTASGDQRPIETVADRFDSLFGGGLSSFGGWIGNHIYDATHSDSSVSLNISNNGANNNPYGGGQTILYGDAVDASPTPAAGSPYLLTGPAANPNANAPAGAPP